MDTKFVLYIAGVGITTALVWQYAFQRLRSKDPAYALEFTAPLQPDKFVEILSDAIKPIKTSRRIPHEFSSIKGKFSGDHFRLVFVRGRHIVTVLGKIVLIPNGCKVEIQIIDPLALIGDYTTKKATPGTLLVRIVSFLNGPLKIFDILLYHLFGKQFASLGNKMKNEIQHFFEDRVKARFASYSAGTCKAGNAD